MGNVESTQDNHTGECKNYNFRQLYGKNLRFKVMAAHDCHLSFTSGPRETVPMVEVFLGGWGGVASAIRFNKGNNLVYVETPGILDGNEYREFWVALDHDEVRVGKAGEWVPFMVASIPEPFNITHYGYSTGWGASGSWEFLNNRVLNTDGSLTYHFMPVYGDTFSFSVACSSDAQLALTSGPKQTTPMYEITLGGEEKRVSSIRLSKDFNMTKMETPSNVCVGKERKFRVSFRNGHIKVGYEDSDPFMEWTDPEPWKVTHVGCCTGEGPTATWRLDI